MLPPMLPPMLLDHSRNVHGDCPIRLLFLDVVFNSRVWMRPWGALKNTN